MDKEKSNLIKIVKTEFFKNKWKHDKDHITLV